MAAAIEHTEGDARYVVDSQGNRVAALLDIKTYEHLVADLEELEAIRAYDAAIASGDEAVSFEEAVTEIERGGNHSRT